MANSSDRRLVANFTSGPRPRSAASSTIRSTTLAVGTPASRASRAHRAM
jgi:hypothetical protein